MIQIQIVIFKRAAMYRPFPCNYPPGLNETITLLRVGDSPKGRVNDSNIYPYSNKEGSTN